MAAKLYVLIRWPDGSRIISIENIKEPRKPFHLYAVGEQVLARCPGFSGLYWGTVEGISENKFILEKTLLEDKELLGILEAPHTSPTGEEQPGAQKLGPPPPSKRSRKSFPRWNPGNGARKFHNRTFKTVVEDREARLGQDPAMSSTLQEAQTFSIVRTGSHPSELTTPHSSSPFNSPPLFLTTSVSAASQRNMGKPSPANRDYTIFAARRKSVDLPVPNDKNSSVNREEKIEQLERTIVGLQQEVLFLKQKVQHLEASLFKEPEPLRQPCEVAELFNGYTREQLKEAIRFDQKISTACKTLLYKLFTSDYIQSHSITGRRGNTFREAKPMMDERCVKIIRVLLKQKFGDHLSDTVITEKIQNVQKALRQKYKTESL